MQDVVGGRAHGREVAVEEYCVEDSWRGGLAWMSRRGSPRGERAKGLGLLIPHREPGRGERWLTLHHTLYGLRVGEDLESVFGRWCSAGRIHCREREFAVVFRMSSL